MLRNGGSKVSLNIGGLSASVTTNLVFDFHQAFLNPGSVFVIRAYGFGVQKLGECRNNLVIDFEKIAGFFGVYVVNATTRGYGSSCGNRIGSGRIW